MEDNRLTLNSFCQLSDDNRTQYTWIYGNLLATSMESDYSYHLYEVDGFYVELIFDRATQQIQSIDPLLKIELLLKYLEDISLDTLF